MFDDVPRATVIITNPTHLAVALRYDRSTMTAPLVIAKGAGHVAKRITDLRAATPCRSSSASPSLRRYLKRPKSVRTFPRRCIRRSPRY